MTSAAASDRPAVTGPALGSGPVGFKSGAGSGKSRKQKEGNSGGVRYGGSVVDAARAGRGFIGFTVSSQPEHLLRGVHQEHPESDSTKHPPTRRRGTAAPQHAIQTRGFPAESTGRQKTRGIYMILATFCSRTMKRSRLCKGGAGLPPTHTTHTPPAPFSLFFSSEA